MSNINVNVTHKSDFLTFLKYLLYLFLLLGSAYIVLHVLAHLTSRYISYPTVDKVMDIAFLHRKFVSDPAEKYTEQIKKIESLRDRYFFEDGFSGTEFSIEFIDTPEINAMLLPSKQIVFTKGILEEITSEEELLFILAHEIGHYKNKDAFKTVVNVLLSSIFQALFIEDSVKLDTTQPVQLHYSRAKEFAADCFAARKLRKIYGNAEGGQKFFEYLLTKESSPQWKQYFETHPSYTKRIENLQKCIK